MPRQCMYAICMCIHDLYAQDIGLKRLAGDNLKLVLAEFSTLSWTV